MKQVPPCNIESTFEAFTTPTRTNSIENGSDVLAAVVGGPTPNVLMLPSTRG